ncbi:hypothetical protein [Maricaulis maris]|uniref:Phage gp6-like head-tail connector protein n=1 Tax=Maricaulis maris TaxID=74318 RepID=A0A495DKW8_9PROT|nr:hypothetical protein [Maricaulis maris]RKR03582.1 hypothetical protein C7435_0018 [Maricaulis maris]
MALLDRVKERTGSDLSDTELQAMIDGVTAEIVARFGPAGPIALEMADPTDPEARTLKTLRLARPIDDGEAITVTESDPADTGLAATDIELDATDYRILHGGRTLQRLTGGPNGRSHWAPLVTITYTPIGEAAARDEAVIKLVQLDLSYRGGLKSERAGDHSFTLSGNIATEREQILESLAQRRGGFLLA